MRTYKAQVKPLPNGTLLPPALSPLLQVLVFASSTESLGFFQGRRPDKKKALRLLGRVKPLGGSDLLRGVTAGLVRAYADSLPKTILKKVLLGHGRGQSSLTH